VQTTVRDLKREADVRATLANAGSDAAASAADRLVFFPADLGSDAGWAQAVAGCEYVLHIASPFPAGVPKHADDLIVPAREGTLRVMSAARDAGVKRVVLTSSFAAIGYGHPPQSAPFDETTWTNLSAPNVAAYTKSKTLAERAAWDFIAHEGGALELSVVNPVGVFGPLLSPDLAASVDLVRRLMSGSLPGSPRLYFGIVDVRDVADLHIRAMTHPAARGERFLALADEFISVHDIAMILKRRMGMAAKRVPTLQLPDWVVRVMGRFNASARQVLPELGKMKNATNAKARHVLGWTPRSSEDALVATAESLVRLGLLHRHRT
jgi:dihydroflavonol-4-reductase